MQVISVHPDCDRDSLIYLADPVGPSCHTGARTCWFEEVESTGDPPEVSQQGMHDDDGAHVPRSTLFALEDTIRRRAAEASADSGSAFSVLAWAVLARPVSKCMHPPALHQMHCLNGGIRKFVGTKKQTVSNGWDQCHWCLTGARCGVHMSCCAPDAQGSKLECRPQR